MDMGWMVPVGIVGAVSARHAFTTWVKAKHGYPIGEDGRRSRRGRYAQVDGDIEAGRDIQLLDAENTQRIGQIDRLQERLATVERIVTDRSHMLDREIERLR